MKRMLFVLLALCGLTLSTYGHSQTNNATDLANLDLISSSAKTLEGLFSGLPSSPQVEKVIQLTRNLATATTLQDQELIRVQLEQEAVKIQVNDQATTALLTRAIESIGSEACAEVAKAAEKAVQLERTVTEVAKAIQMFQDEDSTWNSVEDLVAAIKDPLNEKVKANLLEQINELDWPSDRAKETLLGVVNSFGSPEMVATATNGSFILAAEYVRHSMDDEDEALQQVAQKAADYIEAIGAGGSEGARQVAIDDINDKVTNEKARNQMLEMVNGIGKEGADYWKLAGDAAEGLVAEGLFRSCDDPEKGQAAVDAFYAGDYDLAIKIVGGEFYNKVGPEIAGKVSDIFHEKLDEPYASQLSNITDKLITAGDEEALAQAKAELEAFIKAHAPGDSADDVITWLNSITDGNISDEAEDALRTKAFKSVTKAYADKVIDGADHLSKEEKEKYKQQVADQIQKGDYGGALVDIGRVKAGEWIEDKLGPGTGAAFDDIWAACTDPSKDMGDVAMAGLEFGVIAGKNWLNGEVAEWVDGYLKEHPQVAQALAFFGINGEDIKAGVSAVLDVLTDFNKSLKEKFTALTEMAVAALKKIANAVIRNVINMVKEFIQKVVQESIQKLQGLILKAEQKINKWLQEHGGLITVGFSNTLNTWVQQIGTGVIKGVNQKLDAFGGFLQGEVNKIPSPSKQSPDKKQQSDNKGASSSTTKPQTGEKTTPSPSSSPSSQTNLPYYRDEYGTKVYDDDMIGKTRVLSEEEKKARGAKYDADGRLIEIDGKKLHYEYK